MTITDVRPVEPVPSTGWDRSNGAPAPTDTPKSARPAARPAVDPAISGELLAVAALTLFSIAVAAGYARVFTGWQFFDNFIVLAVLGHGFGFVLRRLRLPGVVAVPVLAVAVAWMIGLLHYRESYSFFLPTGDTIDLFRAEIDLVRQQFDTAVAPVIYAGGWDVIAAIGMGLTIVLSDTFAFRAYARAEALVPGGVLFVFIAALGSDRDRVALTSALVAAGVVATVALRAHHAPHRPTAIGRRRSPMRLVVPGAVASAVVVAVAAGYVGPRLPGADAEAIYDTRGRNGGSVTEVVSPLVDIRSRLTNRSNSELFVVQATFESYWRSSALPRFNGSTWGLPERALSRADGQLSTIRDGSNELRQEIRIVNLGGKFVPTAADPIAASPQEALRWNADSSTLLKTDGDLTSGEIYQIVSASPRFRVEDLQAASSKDAGDPIYLELPDNFPGDVGELARAVTANATTSYETALTLQNWFRTEFEYSLEVQAGHSTSAIEGFLRERVGYCEQFAGTYAAMMRTLGIPARVAVGFTPGTDIGNQSYSVLGKNAHSWPEVWFDGLGWVPFEPTPGRGAPGAENYTNVEPQQDTSGVDADAPVQEAAPGPANSLVPPTTLLGPAVTAPQFDDPSANGATPAPAPAEPTPTNGGPHPLTVLLLLAVGALLLVGPALTRRFNRRRGPTDLVGNVAMLWRRALDAVGEVGVQPRASLTPLEHAAIAAQQFPVASRPIKSLAGAVTEVSFRADADMAADEVDGRGAKRVAECRNWCRQIERAVNDSISPLSRVRRYFTHLR